MPAVVAGAAVNESILSGLARIALIAIVLAG